MQLISQHTKRIMEGCKERAADAGLKFDKETLEYFVTNIDMLELSPKNMIPTLYDFWLQDIQVLRAKGEYEIYPNNPYETVINTRPVISFYNNNNPDWLNVMIFYHVLAHIDFFQNNKFFEKTWDYDFKQKALTEKRVIEKLRSKKGRAVDYVIEFAKGIDNLVGYFQSLNTSEDSGVFNLASKADYYFNVFLQSVRHVGMIEFLNEINKYNALEPKGDKTKDELFFLSIIEKSPEFEEMYLQYQEKPRKSEKRDIMQYLMEESIFLNREENMWMKSVISIIRDTSLYFSPMIRTKTMNEGWASYWHEKLFMQDERIRGHEVAFAKINAKVTALSKIGLNPYAIGWRLFSNIEEMAEKGKYSFDFRRLNGIEERKAYDKTTRNGLDYIFHVRENYCDLTFLQSFIDQEFIDRHDLMVVGQRINAQRGVKEYYIKSRKADDYRKMIIDSLYHPPYIKFQTLGDGSFYLNHIFEGKELYRDYISLTLIGLEYLWGDKVQLETTEFDWDEMKRRSDQQMQSSPQAGVKGEPVLRRVVYSVKDKKVNKTRIAS